MNTPNGQTITICGNVFRLDETIGRGSYGTVHKATNLTSNAIVAIKVISKEKIKKSHERRSIEKEIETMRVAVEQYENGHPHIVRLLCTKESQNHIFIVLEYCAGGDISSYIKGSGGLSEDQARKYMSHLAAGLQFLRSQNVIHRDLKPANLLLSHKNPASAKLKIADFGFARELKSESLAQSVVGSPMYMAPELLEYKSYDAKADLWSVGIILYEMIANDHPFLVIDNCHATNHLALRRNILRYYELHKNFTIPSKYKVSPECSELLSSLLKLNPEERVSFDDFFNADFLLPPRPTGSEIDEEAPSPKHLLVDGRVDTSDWVAVSEEYVIVETEYEDVGREILDERDLESDFDNAPSTSEHIIPEKPFTLPVPSLPLPPSVSMTKEQKHVEKKEVDEILDFTGSSFQSLAAKDQSNMSEKAPNIAIPIKKQTATPSVSENIKPKVVSPVSKTKQTSSQWQDDNLEFEKTLGLSYKSFEAGNIALFVPTPRGDYIAFHQGCPHHYLSSESIEAAKSSGKSPSYVLGHIVFIEDFEANPSCNLYGLREGTPFHVVTVSALSTDQNPSYVPVNDLTVEGDSRLPPKTDRRSQETTNTNKHINRRMHQRISFKSFQISDLALFFLKSGKPHYIAFNQGFPHYYLAEESVTAATGGNANLPAYICGEIIFIDSFQATEDFNPYRLPYGTRFHVVTVAAEARS